MSMKLHLTRALLGAAIALGAGVACAQDFPNRPIRIVIPFTAGGLLDTVGLDIANKFRTKWGQPVILDHRPGASGNIGAEATFKAAPDGHTLLLSPPGPLAINKFFFEKLPYDPDGLTPISVVVKNANVLVVHPSVPARTLREFIDYAKANPGKLNYASPGSGSTPHLTGELFQSMAGIKLVHVPYKGAAGAQTDLIGGHVNLMFAQFSNVVGAIRAGTLRLLAVGSERRSPWFPDVPTIGEALPGFISSMWFGFAGPPGMSPALVDRLSVAVAETMKDPEIAKKLQDLTVETVGSSSPEMAQLVRQEKDRWGAIIRSTGIKAD